MNGYRKLTGPERKQIERTALDHPFFDVPGAVLSRKEAKAIVRAAADRKTGAEIVREACVKADVPCPASLGARPRLSETFRELFTVPAIRRIGIAVLALILIVVFFAATPIGRSIAESVIRYVGTLVDDRVLIINRSDSDHQLVIISEQSDPTDAEQVEVEAAVTYVDSFAAFAEATGKTPFVLPLPCTELYYEYDSFFDILSLFATYEIPDGKIVAYQVWDAETLTATSLTGYQAYDADDSVFYSIENDGYIYCKKILEDSIFSLASKSSYTLDELIGMLTGPDAGNSDEEMKESEVTPDLVYVDSFAAFTEATGKTPFVLPLPCTELYYDYDELIDYLALYTTYKTADKEIVTYEFWNIEDTLSFASTGFKVYDADDSIYYSIEEEGKIAIQKVLEDSCLLVISKGGYTLDELIGMLTGPDAGAVDATIDDSDDTELYVYVDSFEEFTEATGKTPFVLPLPKKEMYYFNEPETNLLQLFSTYDVPNGMFVTYQIWNAEFLVDTSLTGYQAYDADDSVFYSIEDDGKIYCKKILEDSIFSLASKGGYTLDELIGMLKDG